MPQSLMLPTRMGSSGQDSSPHFLLDRPPQTPTVLYHNLAAAESPAVGLVQHLDREADQTLAEVRSLEVERQLEESLAVGED